ncbi:MAG: hypothetical protein ACXADH_07800, partial [Candidatus Kariarchaeaceae archaeon]
MSFDQFKGKLVWGSSVFRILLDTENKRLSANFTGRLVLFDRRHEKSKLEFKSLNHFLTGLKSMWQNSLRVSTVQDTRIARWIEEYLGELGIQASYQTIIGALRGQFEELKPIEVSVEEEIPNAEIPTYISDTETIQSRGVRRKIKGDLDDKEQVETLLDNYLLENKQIRKTAVNTVGSYKLPDGSETKYGDSKQIIASPLSTSLTFESGYTNKVGNMITDINFSDVIPYDYEITDIKITGSSITEKSREKTEKGLKVEWIIPRLDSGQSVLIEYILEKRMLRTILIRDDYDITLLHTYQNINKQDDDIWIEGKYLFQEKTPVVENVKILDQIPSDLKLNSSRPEAIEPLGKMSQGIKETEITWSHSEVPSQTQFVVEYELIENARIFRDLINLVDDSDETVAEIVKIVKPLTKTQGYGVIFAIKAYQSIPDDL